MTPASLVLDAKKTAKQLVNSLDGRDRRAAGCSSPSRRRTGSPKRITAKGVKKTDTLLFVIDVKGVRTPLAKATGDAVAPVDGLPTVALAADGKPTITMPERRRRADRRSSSQVADQGHRPGRRPRARRSASTTPGVIWDTGKQFDSLVGPRRAARHRHRHGQRDRRLGRRPRRPDRRLAGAARRPARQGLRRRRAAPTPASRAPTPSSSSSTSSTLCRPPRRRRRRGAIHTRPGLGGRQWGRARGGDELRPPRSGEPVAEGEAGRDPPDRRRAAPPVPDLGRRGRPPGPVAAGRRSRWRSWPRATGGSRSCSTRSSASSPARPTSSCSAREIGLARDRRTP